MKFYEGVIAFSSCFVTQPAVAEDDVLDIRTLLRGTVRCDDAFVVTEGDVAILEDQRLGTTRVVCHGE